MRSIAVKRYALTVEDWGKALRVLRKLRKRKGVELVMAIFVVDVDDHRRVQKVLEKKDVTLGAVFMMLHPHPPGGPRKH